MSVVVVNPVDSKDPNMTMEKLQSLPPPHPKQNLEGGSRDLPAHTNEPQAHVSAGFDSTKTESQTRQAEGSPPGEIRPMSSESSPQIGINR
jgi:hypothetical protein